MAKATTKQETVSVLAGSVSIAAAGGSAAVAQIPTSIAIDQKRGMRIHRILYDISSIQVTGMAADGDAVRFGLSFLATQPSAGFQFFTPGIIDFNLISRKEFGVAATSQLLINPAIIKNFTDLPGGGKLIHPASLYTWYYVDVALGGACDVDYMVEYTMEDISPDVWDDLWRQIFVSQAG
jgi:hypothetical protein